MRLAIYYYRDVMFVGKLADGDLKLEEVYQLWMINGQDEQGRMMTIPQIVPLGSINLQKTGLIVELDAASPIYKYYVKVNSGVDSLPPGTNISDITKHKRH